MVCVFFYFFLFFFFFVFFFFFNDTAPTEIYTLSLHDALPICRLLPGHARAALQSGHHGPHLRLRGGQRRGPRSEEHTSELQSRRDLVCRLLLEKKKKKRFALMIEKKKKTEVHKI